MRRVTTEVIQGSGSSSNSRGLGTYTYSYTMSSNPDGPGSWRYKTIETLPDNGPARVSRNIVYANNWGEVMLKIYEAGVPGNTQQWLRFTKYDGQGRIILKADPAAVSGYNEAKPDLLNSDGSGHYQYLRDTQGKVEVTDYYATTTAAETVPGGVAGYYQDTKLQRGQQGTPILQAGKQYFAHHYGALGYADVTVTTPGGTSAPTVPDRFSYMALPVVTGLSTTAGPTTGGTSVTITGRNFTGATAVSFGGFGAAFTVNSDTSITATSPAYNPPTTVDVTVTTWAGPSNLSAADHFTYVTPPLALSVSPPSGSTAGGTLVTVRGRWLSGATQVLFGTAGGTITGTSDTAVSVTTPQHLGGAVDVSVTTGGGTAVIASGFTYLGAAPAVTGVSPNAGPLAGGTPVTITGTGLSGLTAVSFGGTPAVFSPASDTLAYATSPAHAQGQVDIQVTTPSGPSQTSGADVFNYVPLPVVTMLDQTSGPAAGGTRVTITGNNFNGATAVSFGAVAVGPGGFTVNSNTSITVTSPNHGPGTATVDVTVTTAGGTSATSAADQFTYIDPTPFVSSISPNFGPTTGGTRVDILGSGFTSGTSVAFGDTAAATVQFVNGGELVATSRARAAAVVDIRATTNGLTSPITPADRFTYVNIPSVTGLVPGAGPLLGGTSVTITGIGFTGASAVFFGTSSAQYQVNSDTSITATAPGGNEGFVDVRVTTPVGTSAISPADRFRYLSAPVVTSVTPNSDFTAGGTSVRITGSNFFGAGLGTTVSFGPNAATITSLLDTVIMATAPAHFAGTVDVTVTTVGGTSTASTADQFTYLDAVPAVTGINPATGPVNGGTYVTITGTGLTDLAAVRFGDTPSTFFAATSDTAAYAYAPARAAGAVDVTVTTPGGTSTTSAADLFTYRVAPVVTGLTPPSGPTMNPPPVTISGSGLSAATQVLFGTAPGTITSNSDTSIVVTPPNHLGGVVDVTVTTGGGTSATSAADQYTYIGPPPAVTGVSPNAGPTAGGTSVTVNGSNFSGATQVYFGSVPATSFVVASDTLLYASAPAQAPSTVHITVSTPGGTSSPVDADRFTYQVQAPAVTAVAPNAGPLAGGTVIAASGTNLGGATAVAFGGTAATAFNVVSPSLLYATAPPHAAGAFDITVTTDSYGGTSTPSAADLFTYQPAPAVTGINPATDFLTGGATVTITGSNFTGATAVHFGIASAASFTVQSDTSIQAVVPAYSQITVYPIATSTVYRNTDPTNLGPETTSSSYTWYPGTTRPQSLTVTRPGISADQNGPGTGNPDTETTVYDGYGRTIWRKDAGGFIHYSAYDPGTGAVTKAITDVDYAKLSASEQASFNTTGWSPPSGGLHLIGQMTVDSLGRTTQYTDPKGNVTYTVYNDANHEVRTYAGWNSAANLPTGPTQVTREDRLHSPSYTESLTMSAVPAVSGGLPTGGEPISGIQSLSRSYTNAGGQVFRTDAYFNVAAAVYATGLFPGSPGAVNPDGSVTGNYWSTLYGYDERGRQNRVEARTGTLTQAQTSTIHRTVYDGLSRAASTWVGTNDAPANGLPWSPSNPGNLVQTGANVYDGGGVGDSNVTQMFAYPNGPLDGTSVREADYLYDWRNRRVLAKEGVQSTEDTTTHRPIRYSAYDNLGEVVSSEQYDGDGVSLANWTYTSGVPNRPDATRLRALTTTQYDDQGRTYRTNTFSVDQSSGAVSANSLTSNTWYDHRGNVIKTSAPGGLVTKTTYDGANRAIVVYTTDEVMAPSWADAFVVTSNHVLTQTETTYDPDGNATLVTTRDRFHDAPATALGPLTSPTGADPKARVSYVASYYDAANRLTDRVDPGSNGGQPYMRPSSPPGRFDTSALVTSYGYQADAVQQVTLAGPPMGGTFTLTFNSQTTAPIAATAAAADVQLALQGAIGPGSVLVSGPAGGPWLVRFANPLAGTTVPQLTADGSGLLGGTVSVQTTSQGGDTGRQQQVTDPRGLVTKTDYDFLGQTLRTIEAFTNFAPSDGADRTTERTYDGAGHVVTYTAKLAGNVLQTTRYSYGVTGTVITSNDLLASVTYPGQAQAESYSYNALGEMVTKRDRNGSQHTLTYDVLGRLTSDVVTQLGAGVDGQVLRRTTAYDTVGRAYRFTSYNSATATDPLANQVNQVQQSFNGLGQLIAETQVHGNSQAPALTVQYTYSQMQNSQGQYANHSRLTGLIYPNGRQVNYTYASGLDDAISRLTALQGQGEAQPLEVYSYLGLDTVVRRAHPEPGIDLSYIQQPNGSTDGGDQYTGLDRFGRIIDQYWGTGSQATDRFQYTYDRDANRLSRTNVVHPLFSEQYGYDAFNQLTQFTRGTHTQTWSLDPLGNWKTFTNDGQTQNRSHNAQNQITTIDAGFVTPTYDPNGNTITDERGQRYVYDAWNRLVQVNASGSPLAAYTYDALGRRLQETETNAFGDAVTRDLYYSDGWQVLEERETNASSGLTVVRAQNVWSAVYVDAMIERDRDPARNGSGSLSERLYVQQDANWNATAVVDRSGTPQERYLDDPYGQPTVLAPFETARDPGGKTR
jgi:YD repeat-containing protein